MLNSEFLTACVCSLWFFIGQPTFSNPAAGRAPVSHTYASAGQILAGKVGSKGKIKLVQIKANLFSPSSLPAVLFPPFSFGLNDDK